MGHQLEKIAAIGPGIVGMPMAAMLAKAEISTGQGNPARVIVVQRNSATSGWKVNAINRGISVIGGIEPELDRIVSESVKNGLLSATHDYNDINDSDHPSFHMRCANGALYRLWGRDQARVYCEKRKKRATSGLNDINCLPNLLAIVEKLSIGDSGSE